MEEWFDLPELVDKVQELIDLGLYDEAKELLDQFAEMFSDEWEIYFLYSRIMSEQNEPQKAIPYLHRGLKIDKTNPDCLLGLFYAYSMMNMVPRGGKYLLRAEKYHSANEMVIVSLIWYYTEINNIAEALRYFEKSMGFAELNPEAFRNGGIAYERIGEHEKAEKCFLDALRINPSYDEVRDLLADHYVFTGNYQKAIDLYKDTLTKSPNNVRIMSRLVFCYSQAGQLEQASFTAKDIISRYPNSPVGYVDLSYVFLNNDDYDNALQYADKALDILPIDPEANRVKGIAYSEKGENEKAEEAFTKAIDLDNTNSEIMRDFYHHLRKVGKDEQMEKWVSTVISLEAPNCAEDYWFLADYYKEKGQNSKAFNYLHKAYRDMPNEKDLIPPMVDILLERSHTGYALSILGNYVEKKGWNEVMDDFARHSKLRNQWNQEGIRLLRFWSDKPSDYSKFIFKYYLIKFLIISACFVMPLTLLPIGLLFGVKGITITTGIYTGIIMLYFAVMFIINKRRSSKIKESTSEF